MVLSVISVSVGGDFKVGDGRIGKEGEQFFNCPFRVFTL